MEVIIRPDKFEASKLVAKIIGKCLKEKPALVLGLATGTTMELMYSILAEEFNAGKIDFSLVRSFNLDEYVGLPPSDPNSYRSYMNKHLFEKINIDVRNTHIPNGVATDLDMECVKYEKKIRECGGIDVQLLGIGSDGHIGFNEPLSALRSKTRVKALTPATIEQNSPLFDSNTKMPKRAITMGVGTILNARRCLLLATGKKKADIIAKAVEGPITSMITASALQLHPKCTIIVDEEAASKLHHQNYYRWIFENEPEWQEYRD